MQMTAEQLRPTFEPFGNIEEVTIIYDKTTHLSKGALVTPHRVSCAAPRSGRAKRRAVTSPCSSRARTDTAASSHRPPDGRSDRNGALHRCLLIRCARLRVRLIFHRGCRACCHRIAQREMHPGAPADPRPATLPLLGSRAGGDLDDWRLRPSKRERGRARKPAQAVACLGGCRCGLLATPRFIRRFSTRRTAALTDLWPPRGCQNGKPLVVKFAEGRQIRQRMEHRLLVANLPEAYTEEETTALFAEHGCACPARASRTHRHACVGMSAGGARRVRVRRCGAPPS